MTETSEEIQARIIRRAELEDAASERLQGQPEAIDDIHHRLTNHPPTTDAVGYSLDEITSACLALGETLLAHCPDTRERSLALTNLEQVSMWAKAAIARHQ